VDVNLTDGQSHRLALYALDWDRLGRSERVDVLDASSGAVLDTRTLSSFGGGQYLVWNLSGHVQLRLTNLAGQNAVLSGLFFDPPVAAPTVTKPADQTSSEGTSAMFALGSFVDPKGG